MTREEVKEMLTIIQAFANGKKIIQDWINDTWKDKEYTSFGELSQSPIKQEPKYRPFKSQEECWNEMLKHQPFGWIKDSCRYHYISSLNNVHIWLGDIVDYYTFKEAFNIYRFLDGTQFGIIED